MKKIDKRKHYYLLLDTETTGTLGKPNVYDLGFAVTDKQGNIFEERSYVIEEIFTNEKLMASAFYYSKMPLYKEGLKTGKFTMVKWLKAIAEMNNLAHQYNTKTIAAYNFAFDSRAMANTHKILGNKGKALTKPMKILCIWGLACETIFCQKTFEMIATQEEWISPAGNYRTTAEMAHRYITGKYDFEEAHTGLEDVRIEAQIMAKCFRQKKKISKGIINHPWRIPNKK